MNFFDHHIGDYDEATSHLTACEDGIYHRLIRKYYAKERPLPVDIPKLQRWVRAKTEEEKQAVIDVMEEFFVLQDDGYHQKTCDEGIASYQAGEPERVVKKANEHNRVTRHRLERSRLFQVLVTAGQHAPWNIGMEDLRKMAASISGAAAQPATASGRKPATSEPVTGTASATPATATQTPVPLPTTQVILSSGGVADATPPAKKRTRGTKPKEPAPSSATFDAYAEAYRAKYHVDPVRNASVNGKLAQFVARVPAEEAPAIAAFYVGHKGNLYVNSKHPVDLLLKHAERLRTDWATDQSADVQRASGETNQARQMREIHAGLSGERVASRNPPGTGRKPLPIAQEVADAIPPDLLG